MELLDLFGISKDVVSTELDGEAVLMHVVKGKYLSLNETGSLIWRELEKNEASLSDCINIIMNEYEVDEALCRGDVEMLLESMLRMEIIEKRNKTD